MGNLEDLQAVAVCIFLALSFLATDFNILIAKHGLLFIPIVTCVYCPCVAFGWTWVVGTKRKWYTRSVRRFYWHRILMPVAAICFNILLQMTLLLNFDEPWIHVSLIQNKNVFFYLSCIFRSLLLYSYSDCFLILLWLWWNVFLKWK